ncbi:MAG: hypothetical protein WCK71_01385 [bacterium]
MLLLEFITWWYGRGFSELFIKIGQYITITWRRFSVASLARTMFDPWRRITTEADKSIQGMGRAMVDNMVSRFVGFTIRLFAIFTAIIAILAISIFGLVFIVAWPIAPLLVLLTVAGMFV